MKNEKTTRLSSYRGHKQALLTRVAMSDLRPQVTSKVWRNNDFPNCPLSSQSLSSEFLVQTTRQLLKVIKQKKTVHNNGEW